MCEKHQRLRVLVNERLTAAAQEIFALFERTIAEYEEELCRSKEENKRKQQLLDSVLSPQVLLHRTDVQVQSESQDQEKAERLRIKKEEEQLQEITEVVVKSEYEEQTENNEDWELPSSSSASQMETEADCGPQNSAKKMSNGINDDVSGTNLHECSVCQRRLGRKQDLRRHMLVHTGEKPFSCPVCEKKFRQKSNLKAHVVIHSDAVETFLQQHQTQTEENKEETEGGCGRAEPDVNVDPESETEGQTDNDEDWETQQMETNPDGDEKKDSAQNSSPSPKPKRTCDDSSSIEDVQIHPESQDEAGQELEQENTETPQVKEKILGIKLEEQDLHPEFTAVSVKSEKQTKENREETENEDWTQNWEPSSQRTEQMETEAARNSSPVPQAWFETAAAKTNTKNTKHECPVCKKKLGRKQELKRHMLLHTGEKPFSCPVCEKRFIQKSNLKSHIVTHLDSVEAFILTQRQIEENTEGEDCGGAETDVSLDLHEMEERADNSSDTDNEEPRAGSSARHMETEAERDDFNVNPGQSTDASYFFKSEETCDDKSQSSLDDLDLFINNAITVNKIAEYQCSLCTKTFGRMENLKRHILIHTGEKAFSCPVCDKRFTLKQHLKLHMVIHSGEKLFSCSVCDKNFNRKDNLRSHMKVHSKDRPFECSVCGARFNLNKNLLRHMTVHTGETPFSCSVCSSGFSSQLCLKRHMKTHSKKKIPTQTSAEQTLG